MYLGKKLLLTTALYAAIALPAQAQLIADVCRGTTRILAQEQVESRVNLEVEVTIEGCDGVCIGSIEYDLLFVDAEDHEIQWHMTETWDWRELDGPFTLSVEEQILPGTTLKEVKEMQIGRCSCSTRATP